MADRVTFTKPAAERIGRVVRIVEAGDREAAPYAVGVRLESSADRVRFCSWTATWTHGSTTSIQFAPATNATATATNVILGVGPGDGWVARKGSAGWSLIGFDMTKQPGYASGDVQLFGHTSGSSAIATWYSITSCATATASP
jgi:hypothetical protein